MIPITWSDNFKKDVKELAESVFLNALERDEAPLHAEEDFKENLKAALIKASSLIQRSPFACQAYNASNPTRRGVLWDGNFVLEYFLQPYDAQATKEVTGIIFSSITPTKSGRYQGAYGDIQTVDFEDLFNLDE